ncbi:universal stress protein [Azohydromonas australica]|uniref:universal stress protein n=1 Tax=Azohydromonas australica TaxID=364039 RepID=UPI0004103AF0|nr:universal stress protein [Azohydromonas australica]
MEELRSLLVHLDGGSHAAARLVHARALAARFEARLSALFAVSPHFVPVPLPAPGLGLPEAPLVDEVNPRTRRRARACFDHVTETSGWPVRWDEITGGDPVETFARRALYADLLVLGQHDPWDDDARDMPRDFVESVLAASGTPALVLPRDVTAHAVVDAGCILVAWRPGREAAHAVRGALPLLQRAREVHLVNWSDDEAVQRLCLDELGEQLRLHAVEGLVRHEGPPPSDPGEALLALAAGIGADLLVMGCYGHHRARELMLGGTTRTLLREARLPLLLAH